MTRRAEAWRGVVSGERRGVGAWLARRGLGMIAIPYRLGVWWRNRAFDRAAREVFRVPASVISVGNLTVGGTGKTPCVEWVASVYRERGLAVAILSRGYGSEAGRNDEAMLLEENLPDVPHLQGADRVALAQTACEELESEVLILDDGFQHRRLHRDLDLLVMDATEPDGYGHLFPRGTLREPFANLRRADAAILTHCDRLTPAQLDELIARLRKVHPELLIAQTRHAPRELLGGDGPEPLAGLENRPLAAFCGIGKPASFERTLRDLGVKLLEVRRFADHHAYTREDVRALEQWAAGLPEDAVVLTTQKDWVKLRAGELAGRPLRALRVGLEFLAGEAELREALHQQL